MRKIILASAVMAAVFVTAGCNKENIDVYGGGTARLELSLSAEGDFVEVNAMTKSEVTADVNEFSIAVIDMATDRTVSSWDRFADVPESVSLVPGEYRIEAKSPGNLPVAWNQPVFEGSQTVTVSAGSTEQVSIVCTIANMKVSVRCTDAFLAEVEPDFTVTVASGDGPLIFTQDRISAGDAGYFDVAPLTMDLHAVRKSGGVVTHHMEIDAVEARDHHVFTLDASGTGYADFSAGISIDYTCNEKQEYILIDGMEEKPVDPEDPDTPSASITLSATAGMEEPVTYSKSDLPSEFNLTVNALAGIEKYEVNVNSAGLRGLLDVMQMPYSVDLANMNADEEGFWGSLFGITSADVKGRTEVVFQIAAFLMAMPNETNELGIVITDKDGETASGTLTIIMTE
ncbi:MAG TPA: DUF4493 domain-containing protein [Candidatus Coprenecus pullistercoris]|nr:DUF4493 domain-containing protein [Candidatus Coprenecus pullistercoris]